MGCTIKNKTKNHAGTQSKPKGFALALTLVIFAILLLLSSTYITLVISDIRFSNIRNLQTQAIFLARSGIEYYRYMNMPESGVPETSVDNNAFSVEVVSINGEKFVKSTGIVNNLAGGEIAKESIIAPMGDLKKWRRTY
ncbi:MAG: hypothetical protein ABIH00_10360 [Armatimonadota bacterium]